MHRIFDPVFWGGAHLNYRNTIKYKVNEQCSSTAVVFHGSSQAVGSFAARQEAVGGGGFKNSANNLEKGVPEKADPPSPD